MMVPVAAQTMAREKKTSQLMWWLYWSQIHDQHTHSKAHRSLYRDLSERMRTSWGDVACLISFAGHPIHHLPEST
jgi:hypothetical protein